MTGNSVIFTRRLRGGAPLSFALRHDVHGVVWDFKEKCADGDASDEALFDHKFTLHAFGFIQVIYWIENCEYNNFITEHALE